jgi:hypothetical protein
MAPSSDWLLVVVEGPDAGESWPLGAEAVSVGQGRADAILIPRFGMPWPKAIRSRSATQCCSTRSG